jgi:hypothetical protein
MKEVFENGKLVGWTGTAFNNQGKKVKVFVPAK